MFEGTQQHQHHSELAGNRYFGPTWTLLHLWGWNPGELLTCSLDVSLNFLPLSETWQHGQVYKVLSKM